MSRTFFDSLCSVRLSHFSQMAEVTTTPPSRYRGRIAPTPTGYLHRGHAATFHTAYRRAVESGGELVLRIEDLDPSRCKRKFTDAAIEDLRWLGIRWTVGPEDGPHAPYYQSLRTEFYIDAWRKLLAGGWIYPCSQSRKDMQDAPTAPHESVYGPEKIFPPEWRPQPTDWTHIQSPAGNNWRFRVPDGRTIHFCDGACGEQSFTAGVDFGDFPIWRRDGVPAYELAVVVDDALMGISEVVRGKDLLRSTARQLLLFEALGCRPPAYYHCPLICDKDGKRLAKRTDAESIRALRQKGISPEEVLATASLPSSDSE